MTSPAVVSVTDTAPEPALPTRMPIPPETFAAVFTVITLLPPDVALIPVPVVVVTMSLELTLMAPLLVVLAMTPPVVPLMVPPATSMVMAAEPLSVALTPAPPDPVTLAPV